MLKICSLFLMVAGMFGIAQEAPEPAKRQFLYVLRLMPEYHDTKTWGQKESDIVGLHVQHLQALLHDGTLILAGKTDEPNDRTFGMVIFEAADEERARLIMNADPAVAKKLMTAELHPYHVALRRVDPPGEPPGHTP